MNKKQNNKTNVNKKNVNKGIQNPTNTIAGKIVIWALIALMALLPLVTLIFVLANL